MQLNDSKGMHKINFNKCAPKLSINYNRFFRDYNASLHGRCVTNSTTVRQQRIVARFSVITLLTAMLLNHLKTPRRSR